MRVSHKVGNMLFMLLCAQFFPLREICTDCHAIGTHHAGRVLLSMTVGAVTSV